MDELEDQEAICQTMEDGERGEEGEREGERGEEGEREKEVVSLQDPEGESGNETREEAGSEGMADGEEPCPALSLGLSMRERSGALLIVRRSKSREGGQQKSLQSKPSLKPWQMSSDKEIYEQQLVLMQEQLTTAMIEKEELRSMWLWREEGREKIWR